MLIPDKLYSPRAIITNVLAIPLFALLFFVIYAPTFGHLNTSLGDGWNEHSSFCIPIVASILLVVLVLSRVILYFYSRYDHVSTVQYLFWQTVEFVVCSLFVDLFLSLYLHVGYFDLLPTLLLYGFLILIFPYSMLWLYYSSHDKDLRLAQAEQRLLSGDRDDGAIKFVDEKGSTKLVVGAGRVIYIESAANYVGIVYDNNGKLARFALRNTLKGIEELCTANNLVRCHRSYFVNLRKVKLLRKDGDAVYAEIDFEGVDDIPVSKTYVSEVVRLFNS